MDAFGDPLPASDDYEYFEEVGHGRFSEIYRAKERRSGREVAVKYLTLSKQRDGLPIPVQREVMALKVLQGHPNIIQYYASYQNDFGVSIVLEYLPNSLDSVLRKGRPKDASWIVNVVHHVLKGLEACHAHSIVHRDISPNNILIDDNGVVKLADFGISISSDDNLTREKSTPGMGTLWYMAPEILLGSTTYSSAVDIWSVGCIILEMVLGRPPFKGRSDLHQICSIIDVLGTPDESTWPGLSEQLPDWGRLEFKHSEAKDWDDAFGVQQTSDVLRNLVLLAKRMIVFNPNQRISAKDALLYVKNMI